jgi:ABC-2 type transport system permease protein
MTSKDFSSFKIYRHAFALSLMQSFPVMLVSLAVILLLVPVSTAGIPEFSIFNLDYTHHQMLFRFFHDNVTLA